MKTSSAILITWLCIVGCINPIFGQSKFSLSLNLAPVYGHSASEQTLPIPDPNTQSATTDYGIRSHGIGYSFGLTGRYAFTTKWSASAGIWATSSIFSTADISFNGTQYSIDFQNHHPYSYAYKIPLLLNYQSSRKRLSPYFSAGASLDFRAKSYVDLGNGQEVAIKVGKPLVASLLLGAGIIYRLSRQLSLVAQPTIHYTVEPRPTYSYYRGYQLSLQTQLMYHF
jgi:hypothetical protein